MIGPFSGDYRFLSNFWDRNPFEWHGKGYLTNEHFYQAHKAVEPVSHEWIRQAPTATVAKSRGNTRDVFTRMPNWDEYLAETIMLQGLFLKFRTPTMARMLLATGDEELVEVNTWGDVTWGKVYTGKNLIGENKLGIALMQVRETLRVGIDLHCQAQMEVVSERRSTSSS